MDILKRLFEQYYRLSAEVVQPLQGKLGGSENVAFLEFSRHFRRCGLPVPEIYAEDLNQGAYLEEDLGDTTLFDFLVANRTGTAIALPPRCRVSRSRPAGI
jgi:aminoglycoside/choline kinase family phosphotransferase